MKPHLNTARSIGDMRDLMSKYVGNSLRFYLKNNPIALRYATASYSQYGEDLALAGLFTADDGFYIDVGAYHPFAFSNTYLFYARGWSGINFEPNPHGFGLLEKYRPRDSNINSAVSALASNVDFVDDGARSRFAVSGRDNQTHLRVRSLPLAEQLNQLQVPKKIDFMSIDCEGSDLEVLQTNDWDRYRPKAVVIEDFQAGSGTPIERELAALEYRLLCQLSWSKIFVDRNDPPISARGPQLD